METDNELQQLTKKEDEEVEIVVVPFAPEGPERELTFYEKYVNKGNVSNAITFVIMIIGFILVFSLPKFLFGEFVLQFGLFGFSGGFTNWLAIKMLFDKIPGLYGSGIIPMKFKEIRENIKNVIMRTFFDKGYLEKYLNQKAGQLAESLNIGEKIKEVLESEAVDKILENKLRELGQKPEGMMFAMMGIDPVSLKPLIKPFISGMAAEAGPLLLKHMDIGKLIKIETLRNELDSLMTTKLEYLTPERVKKMIEDVIREHLGWLVVWGNIFGSLIGIVSKTVEVVFA